MSIEQFKKGDLSVGFVVSHPFYGSPGSVLRIKELSKSLANFGVKVHVYTPYSPDEYWGTNVFFHKIPNIASTLKLQNALYNLTRWVLDKPFFIHHILSKKFLDKMISGFAKNLKATLTEDLDLIQGEQEIAAAACVRVREELGVPVIASLHNIWPEELIATGLIEENGEVGRIKSFNVLDCGHSQLLYRQGGVDSFGHVVCEHCIRWCDRGSHPCCVLDSKLLSSGARACDYHRP